MNRTHRYVTVAAFAALSLFAQKAAADPNVGADRKVLEKFLKHHSHHCTDLSPQRSLELTELAISGKIQPNDYLNVYDLTCKEELAMKVSTEAMAGTLNGWAFGKAYDLKCEGGRNPLDVDQALYVSRLYAAKGIDLPNFLKIYHTTCDLNVSLKAAIQAKAGTLNAWAFEKAIYAKCKYGREKNALAADATFEVATLWQHHQIDLKYFLKTWGRTCNYALSKQIATAAEFNRIATGQPSRQSQDAEIAPGAPAQAETSEIKPVVVGQNGTAPAPALQPGSQSIVQ